MERSVMTAFMWAGGILMVRDGWMKIIPSDTPNTSLPSFSLVAQFSVKLLLKMVRPIWNERISLVLALRREIPSSVPIQILP